MNLRTMQAFARQIAHQLQKNNGGIVLLSGPMGAGKTTLVGEIVRIICPHALTSSPTYTVINQYAENIYHADLYRLCEDGNCDLNQVLDSIGLLDLCVAGNYVFVEWPNGLAFPDAMHVNITVKEDGNREFTLNW